MTARALLAVIAVALAACGESERVPPTIGPDAVSWALLEMHRDDGIFVTGNGAVLGAHYTDGGTIEVVLSEPQAGAYGIVATPTNAMVVVALGQQPDRFEVAAMEYAANALLDLREFETTISIGLLGVTAPQKTAR